MDTVRRSKIAVPVAAVLTLATAALSGCDDQNHVYAGRCAVNGGGYSITTATGSEDTTFEGTWGECVYSLPTFGDDQNPVLFLMDSRVTVVHDEENNSFQANPPEDFKGIIYLGIGMAPVKDPGSIPVESIPFEDWNEFSEASLDGDLAMAKLNFADFSWLSYYANSGNGGTLVIDDVDWPGPDQTGELVLHSSDDMVFPAFDNAGDAYTAKVAMDADLTLTTVPFEGESGSMLNGITTPVGGDLFQ